MKYTWKLKGLTKGVNPTIAGNELQRLQNLHGTVTPELIVKEAEKKKSPLHCIFEWDDLKAGYNYRLQQARTLLNNIEITIISDGESKKIPAYEVVTIKEGYKSIETFTPDDFEIVKNRIIKELNLLKNKLKTYKELEKAGYYIDLAIKAIN